MAKGEFLLVSAPTNAGLQCIQLLKLRNLPFVAFSSNESETEQLTKNGVERIIRIDTSNHETWAIPEYPIGKVFLFEQSLPLCCRYLQICRRWTSKPIYVISDRDKPRSIYKGLGADFLIHSKNGNVTFLIE